MRIQVLERLKAFIGGYFWLPCPNCGRMFGGQEKRGETLYGPTARGRMTCNNPDCFAEVKAKNLKIVWKENWSIPYGGVSYFDPYGQQKTEEDYNQYVQSLGTQEVEY
jgi:hypothetical protein